MTIAEALQVLSAAQHRGARAWSWDPVTMRVEPAGWNGFDCEPLPSLTMFEAVCVARGLARIGAGEPSKYQ